MHPEVKAKWLAALRSGEFRQERGHLANGDRTAHCCLGVLCEVAIRVGVPLAISPGVDVGPQAITMYGHHGDILPPTVAEWAGLNSLDGFIGDPEWVTLAKANDAGLSFEEIAGLIEEYL